MHIEGLPNKELTRQNLSGWQLSAILDLESATCKFHWKVNETKTIGHELGNNKFTALSLGKGGKLSLQEKIRKINNGE